jgi:hypothetical protein
MFRNRAALSAALVRGSALVLLPALALGQNAPSYQLIDLGFVSDNTALHWGASNPMAASQNGRCPSLGGTAPSSESAVSLALLLAVGWSPTAQGTVHAIVCALAPFSYFRDLGVLDGGPNSYALNIAEFANNIVGYSETDLAPAPLAPPPLPPENKVTLAFVSSGGGAIKPLLSAMDNPHYSSQAFAVNDAAEVVGIGQMLFTSGQQSGQVGNRAMLWEPNGQVYNLTFYLVGNPGVTLMSANVIDCHGNIAAYGHSNSDDFGDPNRLRQYLLLRQNPIGSCPLDPPPPR